MLDGNVRAGDDPRRSLSAREAEVMEIAALGLTNAQVADRLKISVHAVKFHLAAIYRKLGVANRTEAAVLFLTSQRKDAAEAAKPFN
jgi:DNA-binding CsgD family transcriptional regulator